MTESFFLANFFLIKILSKIYWIVASFVLKGSKVLSHKIFLKAFKIKFVKKRLSVTRIRTRMSISQKKDNKQKIIFVMTKKIYQKLEEFFVSNRTQNKLFMLIKNFLFPIGFVSYIKKKCSSRDEFLSTSTQKCQFLSPAKYW